MSEVPSFVPETDLESKVETQAEKKERRLRPGVKLVVEFGRHEVPGKLESGVSADFLTDEGKQRAAMKGGNIKEKTVKAYSSPKLRAQNTGDLGLQGTGEETAIINRVLEEVNAGRMSEKGPLQFAKGKEQNPENKFLMRIRPELDAVPNFAPVIAEAKPWIAEQTKAGSKLSAYDLTVQYYLDHPDRAAALGTTPPEEAAEQIAYALSRELNMAPRLKENSDVRLQNFTHGPKLEPFLQRTMVKDGKVGFKSLEEIGGSINPGENFEVRAEADPNGDLQTTLVFRGQSYGLDTAKVEALAAEYQRKLEQKQS